MQMHDLSFIEQKITTIGTAIFYAESKNLLPFQAYVITASKTDREGYVWFSINKNWKKAASQDESFPADLVFYRKGCPYTLTIKGQAMLENEPGEKEGLLIKLKIERADYKELLPAPPFRPFTQLKNIAKRLAHMAIPQWQPSV